MKNKKAKLPFVIRQGDVLVARIDYLPANIKPIARENGRVILAHGEVTFHAHGIAEPHVTHFAAPAETSAASNLAAPTYLEVKEAMAALTHEEHATIQLPPGFYKVVRQREYHPSEIRSVAD